ncbi:AmmeMemoRadiSam system protein B, partial [Candidatus Micrarchaeota archaeon]|nr:AmmeMemoRadiSam system protein B [Candidatus Micrarchaeota archaeon]MBU1939316.1 AmmeMemoRadiSam system protein B [Candidatus Micrarchaeota archaeon]
MAAAEGSAIKVRSPAAAGQFYPADARELCAQLNSFFKGSTQGNDAIAIVSPHAGYVYSGRVAACAFSALKEAGTYIILSPNHTGIGGDVSIYPAGEWETPLGKV